LWLTSEIAKVKLAKKTQSPASDGKQRVGSRQCPALQLREFGVSNIYLTKLPGTCNSRTPNTGTKHGPGKKNPGEGLARRIGAASSSENKDNIPGNDW